VQNGVEVVGHGHEGVGAESGGVVEEGVPAAGDLAPERGGDAHTVRDHAEDEFVVRHLRGHEEPAVGVIDVRVAEIGA
jgi:hypothetical protein